MTRPTNVVLVLLLGVVLVLLRAACSERAYGQGAEVSRMEHLLLTRICVSEDGFDDVDDDCAAIHEVLRSVARRHGLSLASAMRAYSSRATGALPPRTARQTWVASLSLDCREPHGWSALNAMRRGAGQRAVSWSRARAPCLRRVEHTHELLRTGRIVCDEPPDHWGGRMDRPRALRAGWREVECGETDNEFWAMGQGGAEP